MAIIIQQLLKDDAGLYDAISEQLNFNTLDRIQSYADPHATPMFHWKERLAELLDEINTQGTDGMLALLAKAEKKDLFDIDKFNDDFTLD